MVYLVTRAALRADRDLRSFLASMVPLLTSRPLFNLANRIKAAALRSDLYPAKATSKSAAFSIVVTVWVLDGLFKA